MYFSDPYYSGGGTPPPLTNLSITLGRYNDPRIYVGIHKRGGTAGGGITVTGYISFDADGYVYQDGQPSKRYTVSEPNVLKVDVATNDYGGITTCLQAVSPGSSTITLIDYLFYNLECSLTINVTGSRPQLPQVEKPVWFDGKLTWIDVENTAHYRINRYDQNMNLVGQSSVAQGIQQWNPSPWYLTTQYCTVQALIGSDPGYLPGEPSPLSDARTVLLPQVGKPVWVNKVITWNDVEGATNYTVVLYNTELQPIDTKTVAQGIHQYDYTNYTESSLPAGKYYCTVQARSTSSSGPVSPMSDALVIGMYALEMAADGNGTIVPEAGTHHYIEGTAVNLVAMPAVGSRFKRWEGATVEDQNNRYTRITMNGDKSITAVFEEVVELTVVATGGGSTIPPSGKAIQYTKGEVVILKAVPNEGYEFKGWTGDLVDNKDVTQVTMDTDKLIGATFNEKQMVSKNNKKLYFATANEKAYWNVDGRWTFFATPRHSMMKELEQDNHPQYHNNERGDARYHTKDELNAIAEALANALASHTTSSDHDGRYYTETEVDALLLPRNIDVLPTADESHRGMIYVLKGGPGVADVPYICLKGADDNYSWKSIDIT
jgi:hypothetical protein